MSQSEVSYNCGSCGYPLNLLSSNRVTPPIGSRYRKSIKKGLISFASVDLSRFTQIDEVSCLPFPSRSRTKLLCRHCELLIGYSYRSSSLFSHHSFNSSSSPSHPTFSMKIRSLQPSQPQP